MHSEMETGVSPGIMNSKKRSQLKRQSNQGVFDRSMCVGVLCRAGY